jgi:Dolichyl-phosphate-mannose-protein mannosyltransferase
MDRAPLGSTEKTPAWSPIVVACAAALGLTLMARTATVSSATYDETAYLRIAANWWRTGESSEMTRMGSPVTFFKLQAAPAFFVLDRIGLGGLIDRPVSDQATLLPIVRMASLWIWLVAFGITVWWSRRLYGPCAMALAASLFALSPNLLAHGSLMTMEMPLIAATVGVFFLFWSFLTQRERKGFVASAVVAGLAFSCKFTAVVYPPILGLVWAIDLWRRGERRVPRIARTVGLGMVGYVAIMMAMDWAVTGFAVLRASARTGYHPSAPGLGWLLERQFPQDWVGFATQLRHQRNGGPSYLLGQRRMTGWWYYYPVALAVKVPLGCWLLIVARLVCHLRGGSSLNPSPLEGEGTEPPPADSLKLPGRNDWLLALAIAAFLAIAMLGSKRNYGVRYLLPIAPLAIVWISSLAELRGIGRWIAVGGLIGQASAVAMIHPHELSYFNILAGGKIGGRRVLADSNLDWGQGLRSLARIQDRFGPLTLFYFGDIDPIHYNINADIFAFNAHSSKGGEGVSVLPRSSSNGRQYPRANLTAGRRSLSFDYVGDRPGSPDWVNRLAGFFPSRFVVATKYVAVSASLQYGPWGPDDYFRWLDTRTPIAYTDDGTIAIYDVSGTNRVRPRYGEAIMTVD